MTRLSTSLAAFAILLALAPSATAQSDERESEVLDSLRLGEQIAGSRLTFDDLEGRVVLAYHWCVS
jgi:hypothetical protein